MRTRLGNLFGHGDAVDPQQAARDAAERARYEASVRSAQQRVHATMEGDPRVRQLRQEARNAEFDRQRAEGERTARQVDAINARNDARLAHEAAESLRQRAERLPAEDPGRDELMERARRMEAEAAQHEARGQQAEAQAQRAEQRIADAQRRVQQAGHSANEITRALAGRRRGLWHWANVEAESQFRMVGPDHPGPRVSALTGREVPPPVWSNRPYGSEGGLRQVLHVDQARLEQALRDGHGGYVRTPDPKGGWLRLLNAFGLPADPTRGQNCLDTVAALFDTFVHGRPNVAAPRTYDGYRNGNGGAPLFGERGGPGRMEDLTGGRYQALVGDLTGQRTDQVVAKVSAGFEQLHQQLVNGGHGSFASIITGWRGGGSHAWAAVNYEGVVHFVDPQQGKVIIAEPHGGGLRFVDPATGHEVPHPIFDPAGIKAVDALVVDGQARPMPFGDRPPGAWNDRPMTAEYLNHQPPDVRSAQTAEASHRAVLAEHNQAVSDANQARAARQDALRQADEARAHQVRAQDAARQADIEQGRRDAAWDQANQQRALALRHDEAARYYAERPHQGGGPQEPHEAATQVEQHRAAAEQARAQETRLRNEAYQHDNVRQQADNAQRYWQNEATEALRREVTATRAADWFDQQARVHEQQASQLESRYSQHAEQAAADHDQQADRYRREAARYRQEAARYQTGDPRQESADRMRQHYERLAQSAERARDAYRTAHRLEESARQRDQRAEQHAQQAEGWRRHAADRDRVAVEQEQARAEEAARARAGSERADELRRAADELTARGGAEDLAHAAEVRRQADEVDLAAQRHRAEAVARQQARDSATNEAGHARQVAQAHDAAAATERATAVQERQAVPNWQRNAKSWHDQLRGTRAIDPSAEARGTAPEFRPEDLRPDLRARFEALTDPKARAGFEAKFRDARGDQDRLARALEGMRAGAEARGHTLEHALVEHHERDLLKQAEQAAIRPPDEDVAREIQAQLDYIATVRMRIESYASGHPEVVGTERWLRTVEHEAVQLTRELRGENNPSVQKALDRGNNVRGVESEIALAERSRNVVEVGKPVTVKLADATVLKTDVDVVADNGKRWIWRDSKDYHSFGVESSDFEHARAQVIRQLRILLSGEYHRDGGPPRLEWHFPRGVDAEVAKALEDIRVTDPRTGRQSPTHIYVKGDRLVGGERLPEPPEPSGAESPGGPSGHEAEQLFSRDAPRTNADVLLHGTDVPHNLDAVHHVAELIGVDLSGVRVELVVDPEEIRYLDAQGAAAYTPVEKGGTEIRLGPASFADPETLAATVAHEFTHVEQLRSAAELSTATRGALEDLAYASEEPALAVFRARFHGWGEGVGGEVLDRDSLRSSATEWIAGFGDGDGGRHLGGDGSARGEYGHPGSGSGGRIREPDGPEDWPGHSSAGARAEEPGGAGPGADRPELTGGPVLTGTAEAVHGHQIELSLRRIGGSLGRSGHGDFVHHVEVGDDGLVTVTPREGRPFAVRLRAKDIGADHFRVSLGPDGVRHVSISPELLDGRQGVRTDAVVARAIGHASGEVTAEARSQRLGLLRRFGRQDVLTTSVESGELGKLSGGDLAKVGEFQALTRLRDSVSGPRRTGWVDREIGRFIERHGLREGIPGADHRAELVSRYLSAPERAALGEYRAAWRDSDPARALARHVLAEGRAAGAELEPLGLGTAEFRDVYRVDPSGWARDGRLGFTIEVESGRPNPAGALVEITGTDLSRHFRLTVDRDLLAGGTGGAGGAGGAGAEEAVARLRAAIGDALGARIAEQARRPPEIPDWRVRMVDRAATLVAGGGGFEVAELLGAGTVAFRLAGGALADVLTAGYLGRHAALDAAQATHERALARSLQVPRMSGREVRAGTGGVRAEVESIADALRVSRSDLQWTPQKRATDPVVSTADVPEFADRTLRHHVDDARQSLANDAKGVRAIKDPWWTGDLRVSVDHGGDARVRLEVGNTPDRGKVEVVQDRRRFTLRVPPELLAGDVPTLHAALTRALEKVAAEQHEIATRIAHPAMHHAKNAAVDVAQALGQLPLQELSSPHAGAASLAGTVLRKAGEAVASPLTGEHRARQSMGGKSFDSDRTVRSVRETDRSNAATAARDAADNLTYLARVAEYRAAHGTDPDPAMLAVAHRIGDPMPAAYEAMTEVGQRHAGRVTLLDADRSHDGAGARHLRYRLDVARGNRVRLDVTMPEDGTGGPRLVVKRGGWGRFEVEVHGGPEPDLVHKVVGDVAETIIDRRGAGLPSLSGYLRSKLIPTAVNAGTVVLVFAETHALPGLAVGGVTVTGGMLKGVSEYVHELHMTDRAVEQRFAKLDVNEVHTGDLRAAYARTGTDVERFESRVTDQLRQRVAELDQARRQPDLTDARRAALDEQSRQVHQRLDSLPSPDAAVLTPLHAALPTVELPRNGEVRLVDADNHVFVVSFDRGELSLAGRARESLAFDVVTGDTGGGPVRFKQINSDTALTAVVDPHATPEQIRQEIGSWLSRHIDGGVDLPPGRPGAGSQLRGLGRDVTSAASQLGGAALADAAKLIGSAAASFTTAGGTAATGLARIVADAGLENTKAQLAFTRDLAEQLRSGQVSAQHLGVFNGRAGYVAARLRAAQEILEWLGSWHP